MHKPNPYQQAGDPKFIPGIYNYCDRWCERCSFTDRCLNYARAEEEEAGEELDTEAFWQKLQETFHKTEEMIETMARERGIDLNELEPTTEDLEQQRQERDTVENHALARASRDYMLQVQEWFKGATSALEQLEQQLNQNTQLGIEESGTEATFATVSDALEVIRWYQTLISAKVMRALSGRLFDEDEEDDFPSDADGSAKVALLGMDRSIGAWGTLYQHMPGQSDTILDLLTQLERLRRQTEQIFPKARAFQRPGFDTGHS